MQPRRRNPPLSLENRLVEILIQNPPPRSHKITHDISQLLPRLKIPFFKQISNNPRLLG